MTCQHNPMTIAPWLSSIAPTTQPPQPEGVRPRLRLLVIGASGAGTSTLGRALADALASQHFEVDDFFWMPSDPSFRYRREPRERVALMQEVFLPRADWVLSGSPLGWGDSAVMPRLTHALFVSLEPGLRLQRLAQREAQRYGGRIAPGGDRHASYQAFMDWARGYDQPGFEQRSREGHEAWLDRLACPVLRLDGAGSRRQILGEALSWLACEGARAVG